MSLFLIVARLPWLMFAFLLTLKLQHHKFFIRFNWFRPRLRRPKLKAQKSLTNWRRTKQIASDPERMFVFPVFPPFQERWNLAKNERLRNEIDYSIFSLSSLDYDFCKCKFCNVTNDNRCWGLERVEIDNTNPPDTL